nr:MAG TPA: hypothetical protein [Caudoviricetes sp.]
MHSHKISLHLQSLCTRSSHTSCGFFVKKKKKPDFLA